MMVMQHVITYPVHLIVLATLDTLETVELETRVLVRIRQFLRSLLGGLKNLLYNRAGAECNGANTFFSVKDSGVSRFFSK